MIVLRQQPTCRQNAAPRSHHRSFHPSRSHAVQMDARAAWTAHAHARSARVGTTKAAAARTRNRVAMIRRVFAITAPAARMAQSTTAKMIAAVCQGLNAATRNAGRRTAVAARLVRLPTRAAHAVSQRMPPARRIHAGTILPAPACPHGRRVTKASATIGAKSVANIRTVGARKERIPTVTVTHVSVTTVNARAARTLIARLASAKATITTAAKINTTTARNTRAFQTITMIAVKANTTTAGGMNASRTGCPNVATISIMTAGSMCASRMVKRNAATISTMTARSMPACRMTRQTSAQTAHRILLVAPAAARKTGRGIPIPVIASARTCRQTASGAYRALISSTASV